MDLFTLQFIPVTTFSPSILDLFTLHHLPSVHCVGIVIFSPPQKHQNPPESGFKITSRNVPDLTTFFFRVFFFFFFPNGNKGKEKRQNPDMVQSYRSSLNFARPRVSLALLLPLLSLLSKSALGPDVYVSQVHLPVSTFI